MAREAHEAAGRPALGGIGITNQRETVVAWDPRTGEPLHRAIVWQDRRTAARCDELRAAGREPLVPRAHRPGARSLLLRDQDRVAASRGRRGDGRGVRHHRLLARLQAHRPPRDRLLERLAHAAVRHPRARAGTPSCARSWAWIPASLPEPAPSASVLRRHERARRRRCRWPGSPATSRRRCTGRPATRPASARTPTAPAASCSRTREPRRRRRRTACSPPSPGAWRAVWTTRSRPRSS